MSTERIATFITDDLTGGTVATGMIALSQLMRRDPKAMPELLVYAFRRIKFLENALGVEYSPDDMLVPEAFTLIHEEINGL